MIGYLQVAPTYQGADILDGRGRVIARVQEQPPS